MTKEEVIIILKNFNHDLTSPVQLLPHSQFLQVSAAGAGGTVHIEALNVTNNGGVISANGGNAVAEMNIHEFTAINQHLSELIQCLENNTDEGLLVEILKKLKNSALPSAIFNIILNLISSTIGHAIGI